MNSKDYKPGTKLRMRNKQVNRYHREKPVIVARRQYRRWQYRRWLWPEDFDLENWVFFRVPPK